MGLLPNIGIDVSETARNFMAALNRIERCLSKLLEIEKARDERERSQRAGATAANRALGVAVFPDRLPYRVVHSDGRVTYPQAEAAGYAGGSSGGCTCNPKAAD
jgi:hypothetical protein